MLTFGDLVEAVALAQSPVERAEVHESPALLPDGCVELFRRQRVHFIHALPDFADRLRPLHIHRRTPVREIRIKARQ